MLAKDPANNDQVQAVCTQGLNLFKILTTYLKPILPTTAEKVAAFLNIPTLNWQHIDKPLTAHTIKPFKPLMQRVPKEAIDGLTT